MSMRSLAEAIVAQMSANGCKNPMLAIDLKETPTGPYTMVYFDPGIAFSNGYDGKANRVSLRWQVMSVSNSERAVLDMAKDVRDALTDFSPGATRESGRMTEEFSGPAISTNSAPLDSRYSLTLNYVMTTHRGEV